jgi:hypothetical protein
MTNEHKRSTTRYWAATWTIVALISAYAFFQDIIAPDWPAWIIAPLLVIGFRAAVWAAQPDGLARAALYQSAIILVPFMAVYGVVDAILKPDWPAWVIAPIVALGLWIGMANIAEAEDD